MSNNMSLKANSTLFGVQIPIFFGRAQWVGERGGGEAGNVPRPPSEWGP